MLFFDITLDDGSNLSWIKLYIKKNLEKSDAMKEVKVQVQEKERQNSVKFNSSFVLEKKRRKTRKLVQSPGNFPPLLYPSPDWCPYRQTG